MIARFLAQRTALATHRTGCWLDGPAGGGRTGVLPRRGAGVRLARWSLSPTHQSGSSATRTAAAAAGVLPGGGRKRRTAGALHRDVPPGGRAAATVAQLAAQPRQCRDPVGLRAGLADIRGVQRAGIAALAGASAPIHRQTVRRASPPALRARRQPLPLDAHCVVADSHLAQDLDAAAQHGQPQVPHQVFDMRGHHRVPDAVRGAVLRASVRVSAARQCHIGIHHRDDSVHAWHRDDPLSGGFVLCGDVCLVGTGLCGDCDRADRPVRPGYVGRGVDVRRAPGGLDRSRVHCDHLPVSAGAVLYHRVPVWTRLHLRVRGIAGSVGVGGLLRGGRGQLLHLAVSHRVGSASASDHRAAAVHGRDR
eukprot:ctg_1325.g435